MNVSREMPARARGVGANWEYSMDDSGGEPRCSARNGTPLHLVILCFRRSVCYSVGPEAQGVAGSNPVCPTAVCPEVITV